MPQAWFFLSKSRAQCLEPSRLALFTDKVFSSGESATDISPACAFHHWIGVFSDVLSAPQTRSSFLSHANIPVKPSTSRATLKGFVNQQILAIYPAPPRGDRVEIVPFITSWRRILVAKPQLNDNIPQSRTEPHRASAEATFLLLTTTPNLCFFCCAHAAPVELFTQSQIFDQPCTIHSVLLSPEFGTTWTGVWVIEFSVSGNAWRFGLTGNGYDHDLKGR